jgi:hypothetical protein
MSNIVFFMGEVFGDAYQDTNLNKKDPDGIYYIDVITYPEGNLIKRIQIPRTVNTQIIPKQYNLILFFKANDFDFRYAMTLKDSARPTIAPQSPLRRENIIGGKDFHLPAEYNIQSEMGAEIHLDNSGSVNMMSADGTQKVILDNSIQQVRIEGIKFILSNKTNTSVEIDKSGIFTIKNTDPTGTVTQSSIIIDNLGNININSNVNSINITSANDITIQSAKNINIKSLMTKIGSFLTQKLVTSLFKELFNTHIHTAATGPTTPPLVLMTDLQLTSKTEAE